MSTYDVTLERRESQHSIAGADEYSDTAASTRVREGWPWVGVVAGLLGIVATLFGDIHLTIDGQDLVTADMMGEIDRGRAHLSVVSGYVTVAMLLVLAASWRGAIESRFPLSSAARVVTQGLAAAAAALTLGYGWKGASAIYHADGMDGGFYDNQGLVVYYILNDFGSYIGWLGVTVAAGAVAWMALRERILPLWLGLFSVLPVIGVVAMTGGTGLPGFPALVGTVWMVVAFAGLGLTRLPARQDAAR